MENEINEESEIVVPIVEHPTTIEDFKEEIKKKVSKLKGIPRSEETKAKMRKPRSEEGKRNLSIAKMGEKNSSYGVKKSEETKAKTSATMKGTRVGAKNPNAKLSELDVQMIIKKRTLFGFSITLLAVEYDVTETNIFKILSVERKRLEAEQEKEKEDIKTIE